MTRKPTIAPLLATTLALALAQAAQAQTLDATSTTTGTAATTIDSSSTLQSVSIDPNVAALRQSTNTFSRMFRNLPPFALQSDSVRTAMKQLGAAGGVLDAKDVLTDPIQSITNPAVFSPNNADNPNMTAGVTFFGQFLDHDITLDKNSPLNQNASPDRKSTRLNSSHIQKSRMPSSA